MLQFRLNKNDRTSPHLGVVRADLHAGASADDVVHLVFAVRRLGISAAFRQNVNDGAHGWDAEEFEVTLIFFRPLPSQIVNVEEVGHRELTTGNEPTAP